MMKKLVPFLIALFALASVAGAQVQRKTTITEGRRYVVAFPQVWPSPTESPLPQPMMIFVGSKYDTKVTVKSIAASNDAGGINRTYTIRKNQITKIPVSTAYMNQESESIKGYGIEVVGEKPITVYTYQSWMGNGELARHLPVQAWGKSYYTMNFYLDRYGNTGTMKYRPSQSLIVAAYDNTVVTLTPTVDTEGGASLPSTPKGLSSSVTLNKGETFLVKSKVIESELKEFVSDMSGTLIRSSRPVGIVSGHTKVAIMRYPDALPPTGMFRAEAHFVRNNVHDAMLPLEMAGTRFVTTPCRYTPTRVVGQGGAEFGIDDDRGDVIRVIALEDNTTVRVMRQNGSGLLNKWLLRRGETRLETDLQEATYWESDKPILMGQYGKSYAKIIPPAIRNNGGKGGDEAQGHPTVESGMPMLQYIPSVNRWADYGVFNSPEGMDNFINIVFKTTEVSKIKFDGRLLTSAFGGAIRQIQGTEFSYISANTGSGDHFIESDFGSNVKWVAWTYGSLDGLQQGRAYGTPISFNLAAECDDSLILNVDTLCGDLSGKIDIISESEQCLSIFDVYLESPVNCSLVFDDEVFTVSPNSISYPVAVTVNDRTRDASATLIVITKAGTVLRKEFVYKANAISTSTKSIDFGIIAVGDSVCNTFTVTNIGDKTFYIADIRARFNQASVFVTPKSGFIAPGQTLDVEVCVKGNFTGNLLDSIVFSYASYITENFCYEVSPVEIKARTDEPNFFASDQDWGIIGKTQTVTKQVTLVNTGDADVVVTDYNPKLTGPFFSNLRANFPITITKGQRVNIDVDYTPNGEVGISHTERVLWTVNATKTKLYSDLRGQGADASLTITNASWTERVIDPWQVNNGITEYVDTIYVDNVGIRTAVVSSISVVGQDASSFRIVDASGIPTNITGLATGFPIVVAFIPSEDPTSRSAERTYSAKVQIDYQVDGNSGSITGDLNGTALQPRLSATGYDFGTLQVGSSSTHDVYVFNVDSLLSNVLTSNLDGTMDMELFELAIPNNAPFVWTRTGGKTITYNPSSTVKPGVSFGWAESVTFSPSTVGSWSVPFYIKYNGTQVATPILIGRSEQSTSITSTDLSLINWFNHSVDGVFEVTSTSDGVIEVKDPTNGDYVNFTLLGWIESNGQLNPNYKQIPVLANVPVSIVVRFVPSMVTSAGLVSGQNLAGRLPFRTQSFVTDIEVEEVFSGLKTTSTLVGDGKYLESTVFVPDNYTSKLGEYKDVYVYLKDVPQSPDSGYVSQFRSRLSYDKSLLYPVAILTENTQTDGWRQVSYNVLGETMIELDLKSDNGSTLNNTNDPIYGVRFQTLLSQNVSTQLPVQLYWVDLEQEGIEDRTYMVFNYEPGALTVNTPCAGALRLISVGSSNYYIRINNNVIQDNMDVQYGVGITAHVEMFLVNIMGEVVTLMSGSQTNGGYHFTADISDLASGVYYLVYRSGDFSPSPIKLVKQ